MSPTPSEHISIIQSTNSNMPVLKFYLDLYYDDFGTFRNTYNTLGLVPFGRNFRDFIKVFIEKAGYGYSRFAQRNNISGVLHHNTNFGCHSYETKAQLNFSRKTEVINCLIRTWGLSARASKNVFLLTINRSHGYYQLQKILDKEFKALIKALLNTTKIRYYQNVSYSIIEPNSNYQDIRFNIGEAVEATLSNDKQPVFRMVKGIIEH
ncbi:12568_t:CDS:2 [Racocetra persica]|uniref:12568_t:CDS:1 n=1 Tax=Racocetra persica TaxID=160502 RepID=A0ACA9L7G1_9GLOM|nr:12568_t:CDS:2 [Racocetra persica]